MVLKVVFIYLFIIGAVLEGSRLFNIFHLILIIQTGWVIMRKGELGWKSPFWVPSEKKIIIIPLDWVVSWIGSHNNEMYSWTVGHCIVAVFRENYFRLGKTCLRTRLFYHYPPGLWLSLLLMRYHWNKYHWSWSLVLQCETLLRSRVVPTTCSKLAKRLSSA